jgi:hypothetical protein
MIQKRRRRRENGDGTIFFKIERQRDQGRHVLSKKPNDHKRYSGNNQGRRRPGIARHGHWHLHALWRSLVVLCTVSFRIPNRPNCSFSKNDAQTLPNRNPTQIATAISYRNNGPPDFEEFLFFSHARTRGLSTSVASRERMTRTAVGQRNDKEFDLGGRGPLLGVGRPRDLFC